MDYEVVTWLVVGRVGSGGGGEVVMGSGDEAKSDGVRGWRGGVMGRDGEW